MKNVFPKAIFFIKENPSIIFSLILVVLIPSAFFINIYLINSNYEKNINEIMQSKAYLAENIITTLAKNQFNNISELQSSIEKIASENSEIVSLSIFEPAGKEGQFKTIASSDTTLIGQIDENSLQKILAWNRPEGIAFLDENDNYGRYWKETKIFEDKTGQKVGLVEMIFSIKRTDAFVNNTIYKSYWVLFITLVIVLIFVSNQARLFGYALAVVRLKEIDKMKDMFISIASHELRSPLTAIKGYLEFLKEKEEVAKDKESCHYLENIDLSVERLQNLVNDILEVSRLEGNRLPIEISKINPDPIIKESIEELRSQAIQKGLSLNLKLLENPVLISTDPNRLKQVLINLIGNSIKYTEKGLIDVSTDIKKGEFLITVADTGIGISSEDQVNLFQKFYRVQTDRTKNIIGTGLGLWITLEIVRRMKGKITIESIEGVGSHFTVHLPITKA
jgi:signal transduction histidine kinase